MLVALQSFFSRNFEKVIAVEPNPYATECLRRNIALNGLGNVELRPIAISNVSGISQLYISVALPRFRP